MLSCVTSLTRALLVSAIVWASPAGAAPAVPTSAVTASQLPKGVTARGELRAAVTFDDKLGTNYVVFSSAASAKQRGGSTIRSATLYVDLWVVASGKAPRNQLPVRDMVTDCEMGDATAVFHDAAFAVTDLDRDGVAEITFGYEVSCRSDVSPATYKLLVIEQGKKYILRGQTRIPEGDGVSGGTFKADPAEAKWPAAFLAHAKDLWAKTSGDLEIPPRP